MTQEQREELKRIQGMMDILCGCAGVTITREMGVSCGMVMRFYDMGLARHVR